MLSAWKQDETRHRQPMEQKVLWADPRSCRAQAVGESFVSSEVTDPNPMGRDIVRFDEIVSYKFYREHRSSPEYLAMFPFFSCSFVFQETSHLQQADLPVLFYHWPNCNVAHATTRKMRKNQKAS